MLRTCIAIVFFCASFLPADANEQKVIQLASIDWAPYTGSTLYEHGFFSQIVSEALRKVGYRAEFQYYPWARALFVAKKGRVHGIMTAYRDEDRTNYFSYPDVVWKVRESFISHSVSSMDYTGELSSLEGQVIGVLRGSVQAKELEKSGVKTEGVTVQTQNIDKLLRHRIDAVLMPAEIFFYNLKQRYPDLDELEFKTQEPSFKVFDMYVAFSKLKPGHEQLTHDFNRGLNIIKNDGTLAKVLTRHKMLAQE